MRISIALFICCVVLVLGCAHERYITGHGDAGQFMLRQAVAYGGRLVTTNDLPVLEGYWQYVQDKHGVVVVFPASQYSEVESFFTAAFGPRSNKAGWGVRDVGVAIYLQKYHDVTNTLVGIHPPNFLDIK